MGPQIQCTTTRKTQLLFVFELNKHSTVLILMHKSVQNQPIQVNNQVVGNNSINNNNNDNAYRSTPSGSRAHNLRGMGYDHVLPHLGDEEAERMLSKQRQVSYKNDLDRLVEMRNKREQAQQAQQPQMSQMSQMPHVSARTASSRVGNGSSAPEREYNVNYDNNMLSRLGNHHQSHHPTEQPPNFGRGLSSMHTGKRDLDGEEYARMKQLQYRLELESQMEEQKFVNKKLHPLLL